MNNADLLALVAANPAPVLTAEEKAEKVAAAASKLARQQWWARLCNTNPEIAEKMLAR